MPLQKQNVVVPFSRGIDTKTDDNLVSNETLLGLKNAVFTKTGSLRKRRGYSALTLAVADNDSPTAPQKRIAMPEWVSSYEDELLLLSRFGHTTPTDQGLNDKTLWRFSRQGWAPIDTWWPVRFSVREIHSGGLSDVGNPYFAAGSRYSVLAMDTNVAQVRNDLVFLDRKSGSRVNYVLSSPTTGAPATVRAARVIRNSLYEVLFFREEATDVEVLSFADFPLGGETANLIPSSAGVDGVLDVAEKFNGDVIVARTGSGASNDIDVFFVKPDGTLDATPGVVNLASTAYVDIIAVKEVFDKVNDTRLVCVFFRDTSDDDLYALTLNIDTLAVVTTFTNLVTLAASDTVTSLSIHDAPDGSGIVFAYSFQASGDNYPRTQITTTDYTLGSIATEAVGSFNRVNRMMSKLFDVDGKLFYVAYRFIAGTTQGSMLIRAIDTEDISTTPASDREIARLLYAKFPAELDTNFNSEVAVLGDGIVAMASLKQEANQVRTAVIVEMQFKDFRPDSRMFGESLLIGGGTVGHYDGGSIAPINTHFAPEDLTASALASGGSMSDGTYLYRAVYEWYDSRGNRHQSKPSETVSITLSGGTSVQRVSLAVTIDNSHDADVAIGENDVTVGWYRTEAGGTTFYKTGANVFAFGTLERHSFFDANDDATLITNELLYTTGGVVENAGLSGSEIVAVGKNRAWVVPMDDPTLIQFSKEKVDLRPPEFSDSLSIRVEDGGPIVALHVLDDKIVVFKERRILYFTGPGPNALGQGQFSPVRPVATNVGCVNRESVVETGDGLFFKSHKGIYLLGRDFHVQYIGAPVERYNNQDVLAANLLERSNEVRFVLRGGPVLVYDNFHRQWGTFDIKGRHATVWQGKHVIVTEDGDILAENETDDNSLDNQRPYSMEIETGWFQLAGIMGYQRVYWVSLLGEFLTHHKFRVKVISRRQGREDEETVTLDSRDAVSQGDKVYEYRIKPRDQKCEAMRFVIFDENSEDSGESYSLSAIALEVGVIGGPPRLGAGRTA